MERLWRFMPRLALIHRLRSIALLFVFLALAGCSDAGKNTPSGNSLPIGEGFDFYVLSLSWSPGYCASEGQSADKRQCEAERPYQFVVHGLWPQYEKGYPQNCASDYGATVDSGLINSMLDIMPSYGLIIHQWRKHGQCSGLSQQDYFAVTRSAYEKIKTPPSFNGLTEAKTVSATAVEKLFQAENNDLPAAGIAATCKNNYLRDVRICMTKDLAKFRPCPEVDRNYCRANSMAVAPVR